MDLTTRISKLKTVLQEGIYEKEEIFNLTFLAMLGGESIFLLGKPGTAKSLIARRIKYAFKQATVFEYLMNRFSTPEEIYGPISINELKKGIYARLVEGYLPTANVVFLDEIWKAGPSIQNTLLTIINEKIYRNAGEDLKVPLNILVAASNELPARGEGLEALFDRFIIRYICAGVQIEKNFNTMIDANTSLEVNVPNNLVLTQKDIIEMRDAIKKIKLSEASFQFINSFRKTLAIETSNQAYISDRRWKKIVGLMKTSAFANGRQLVDKADWLIIPECIWDNEKQQADYSEIFYNEFINGLSLEFKIKKEELSQELQEIQETIQNSSNQEVVKNIYHNPFNGKLKGNYYRLIHNGKKLPICFINILDFRKIKKNKKGSVNLYFAADLSNLKLKNKEMLILESDSDLFGKDSGINYKFEIKDAEGMPQLEKLAEALKKIEDELELLKKNAMEEKGRLLDMRNIFFENKFELAVQNAFFLKEGEEDKEDNQEENSLAKSS